MKNDGFPKGRACPICRKPTEQAYRPFCSKRCADVDLHRWLSGSYALPAVETEDDMDAEAGPGPEGTAGAGQGRL